MQEWIIEVINQFGYWGIMILIAVENIFPPIPSEVILTFGGFITTYTELKVWGVVIFATIGSLIGAIVLYGVGRLLKPERLELWLSGKWAKRLRFKKEDVDKAVSWFHKQGNVTVFFCRFIPIVRSLISIPAGIAKMNMVSFLVLTTIGTFIWNIVLVNLGAFAGESWEKIVEYMDTYSSVALILFAIALVGGAGFYFYKKKKTAK